VHSDRRPVNKKTIHSNDKSVAPRLRTYNLQDIAQLAGVASALKETALCERLECILKRAGPASQPKDYLQMMPRPLAVAAQRRHSVSRQIRLMQFMERLFQPGQCV
jgi:hypothetical protein